MRTATADLRPDWSRIYAYGCRAYPLNRDRAARRNRRSFKILLRGHIRYLVGYRASNIYRIWVPSLDEVFTTRNVTFDEQRYFEGRQFELLKAEAALIIHTLSNTDLTEAEELFE